MIWQTLKTNEMTNHKFYSQSSVWFERHWLEHSFCSNRCELRGRDIQMLTWEMGGRQFMAWLRSVEGVSFKFIWVHTAGLHPAWDHCFTSRRRGRSWLIFITVLNKFCLVCSNTYGKGLLIKQIRHKGFHQKVSTFCQNVRQLENLEIRMFYQRSVIILMTIPWRIISQDWAPSG